MSAGSNTTTYKLDDYGDFYGYKVCWELDILISKDFKKFAFGRLFYADVEKAGLYEQPHLKSNKEAFCRLIMDAVQFEWFDVHGLK